MPFQQLGLDAKILRAVQEAGYTEPTPIQVAAIPPVIAGHDLIGIAQTGTGKTAAFTLPMLTKLATQPPGRRGTRVLVVGMHLEQGFCVRFPAELDGEPLETWEEWSETGFLADEGSVQSPDRPLSTAVLAEARDVLSDADDGSHLHLQDDEE